MSSSVSAEISISSTNLDQLLDQTLFKQTEHLCSDTNLQKCPNCHGFVRKTNVKERLVDHLHKQIIYEIVYYYCDFCHLGWPSLPVGVLPNITCGIDVLGHLAYWHVLKQQSFQTLKEHLRDCHGIERSERTIQRYLERFALLTEDTRTVFDTLVQAYLKGQKKTQGLYDEAFFSSRYPDKLCLSVLFLPDVRVIAGFKVTTKRNQEMVTEIMTQFQQRFGELDVIATDLSSLYNQAVIHAFTAATLQFCVFHFFQILERNLVKPLAQQLLESWKERTKDLKKRIETWHKMMETALPGKYQSFLSRLTKRIQWCLSRRRPDKIQAELKALGHELQMTYQKYHEMVLSDHSETKDRRKIGQAIEQVIEILSQWERLLSADHNLQTFRLLQQQISKIQQLFQESNEERFDLEYQTIINECLDSPEHVLQHLGKYLQKYQDNLSVYLQWGLEKTTSLLEQVFQRLKKTTSNGRGGKDQESLDRFAQLYQFFWNVEPLRLRGERTADTRSPLARLGEHMTLPIPLDLGQRWWYWLSPMAYHDYRNRVREFTQQRRKEWNHIQEFRKEKQKVVGKTVEERAQSRWKQSKTLRSLKDLMFTDPQVKKKKKFTVKDFVRLELNVKVIYNILLLYPSGLSRKKLVELIKLPRTTIYDKLVLLQTAGLVTTKLISQKRRGRPVTLFLAKPLPER